MRKLVCLLFGALVLCACAMPQQKKAIHPDGQQIDCQVYQNDAGGVAIYSARSSR